MKKKTSSDHFDVAAARKRCLRYRRRILDISQKVAALHIAPAFSCMEIVDCIYNGLMRRVADGTFLDSFILSKGHGCMTQYVILEDLSILPSGELDRYCTRKPGARTLHGRWYGGGGAESCGWQK
jgi:transketolase